MILVYLIVLKIVNVTIVLPGSPETQGAEGELQEESTEIAQETEFIQWKYPIVIYHFGTVR